MGSLRNGRMVRGSIIDITEIRRRRAGVRASSRSRLTIRIANGRYGEDLSKMMSEERVHTEWLTRNAWMAGICMGSTGEIQRCNNFTDNGTYDVERWTE